MRSASPRLRTPFFPYNEPPRRHYYHITRARPTFDSVPGVPLGRQVTTQAEETSTCPRSTSASRDLGVVKFMSSRRFVGAREYSTHHRPRLPRVLPRFSHHAVHVWARTGEFSFERDSVGRWKCSDNVLYRVYWTSHFHTKLHARTICALRDRSAVQCFYLYYCIRND